MTKQEYDNLQNDLSLLLDSEKLRGKGLNAKERCIYEKVVLACKSVAAKYNPEKVWAE